MSEAEQDDIRSQVVELRTMQRGQQEELTRIGASVDRLGVRIEVSQ